MSGFVRINGKRVSSPAIGSGIKRRNFKKEQPLPVIDDLDQRRKKSDIELLERGEILNLPQPGNLESEVFRKKVQRTVNGYNKAGDNRTFRYTFEYAENGLVAVIKRIS